VNLYFFALDFPLPLSFFPFGFSRATTFELSACTVLGTVFTSVEGVLAGVRAAVQYWNTSMAADLRRYAIGHSRTAWLYSPQS
jgi:hypothetical protein